MAESWTEPAAPRRSSRISAQAKPEAPAPAPAATTKARKGSSAAQGKAKAKTTKTGAGTGRKRALKEEKEEEEDQVDDGESEHDAKKAKLPSVEPEEAQLGTDHEAEAEEPAPDAGTSSAEADAPQQIDIGGSLPSLVLKNEQDEDVDTASLAADKGVVLFLVPKADTPGCTTQACAFRDVWQEFGTLNYDVYCLSADSPIAQTKWQTKKQLPYQLLSDPQRRLIGALGAADGNKTKRSHFVFEKGGKLVDKKMPVKPADSPRLALEFIKGTMN